MVDNFLDFLFNFFDFLYFFYQRKVILIDLRSCFLHLKIRKFLFFSVLHFFTVGKLHFGLGLVTYDTTFRPGRHKRPIRIDFLFNLNFFYNDLLLNDGFTRHKVLEGVGVLNRKNFCSHKWISDA
jgi:hypothetical protein